MASERDASQLWVERLGPVGPAVEGPFHVQYRKQPIKDVVEVSNAIFSSFLEAYSDPAPSPSSSPWSGSPSSSPSANPGFG